MTSPRRLRRRTALKAMGLGVAVPTVHAVAGCDNPPATTPPERDAAVLDLSFQITERYRPFELVAPGFEQVVIPSGRRITGIRRTDEVPSAPFAAVELTVEQMPAGGVVAGLAAADGDHVLATFDPGTRTVAIEVRRRGREAVVSSRIVELEAPFGFAFVLCENQVTALARTGGGWEPLLTERDGVAALLDLRDEATLSAHAFAFGARTGSEEVAVRDLRAGPFGYTGLRDPHLVQRPDGTAVVRDGQAYLTFTCAGMGFFQQAHWGVFTLDLADPTRLVQVAQLITRRDGLLLGDHAGQLVVDERGQTLVGVSSWGDFAFDGVHVRHLTTADDLLSGTHLLETVPLTLPTTVSSWDPSFTRIDDRWYAAFVESRSQDPFTFHPALAVGAPGRSIDSGLDLVGVDDSMKEGEGTLIQQVAGSWHVLASNRDRAEYPVYDLTMHQIGALDAPYGSNIPHPQLIDLPGGGHLLVTFDGTPYGEDVLGYGSHGDVVVMAAR